MRQDVATYGDPALRKKAVPVERFDEGLRTLAAGMIEVMRAHNGLGLAAEQVGETAAICVIEVPPEADASEAGTPLMEPALPMPLVLVNPEISEEAGSITGQEGCLSFPEIYVPVARAAELTVTFQDLEGRSHRLRARRLLARAVLHELDHLRGVLLVDRMSAVKRVSLSGRLKKLKKETAEKGGAAPTSR